MGGGFFCVFLQEFYCRKREIAGVGGQLFPVSKVKRRLRRSF